MVELKVMEQYTTRVIQASEQYAGTGLQVEKGQEYKITVQIVDRLTDKSIPVDDTDGFDSSELKWFWQRWLMTAFESKRRSKDHNWFFLLGSVGESGDHLIEIGGGRKITTQDSGQLYVFLNDHPAYYGNNCGSFRLSIVRKE